MAIRLPSVDSTQFFTWRDLGLDAVNENLETQVKISLSANVVVCHSISLESELTDITESIERNINAMVFTKDDDITRNLKGLDKFVKKMAFSSAAQRNK